MMFVTQSHSRLHRKVRAGQSASWCSGDGESDVVRRAVQLGLQPKGHHIYQSMILRQSSHFQ